jgi:hypothetical protein
MIATNTALYPEHADVEANSNELDDLRRAGVVYPGNALILGVEAKVDAGEQLTPLEFEVLQCGITQADAAFFRQNPDMLKH